MQILQVIHGARHPRLRTPRISRGAGRAGPGGVLSAGGGERLAAAYGFLRRLINGLRMLRGSAQDLFLPPLDSDEYVHLARRMGYARGRALAPEQQLHLDFETATAAVRAFVERHFGRESLPGAARATWPTWCSPGPWPGGAGAAASSRDTASATPSGRT